MNKFADTQDPIETIHQAVGAASMCWENIRTAGVFDDREALTVCDHLIERLVEQGVVFP